MPPKSVFPKATPAPGPSISEIKSTVSTAYWWGQIAELERLNKQLQQPGQRTEDGRSRLAGFRQGLEAVSERRKVTEAYFVQLENLTLEWAAKDPTSALARVLHAQALFEHGWWYRGTGYANTVPPQAWEGFNRHITQAAEYLAANATVAFTDTQAHVLMIWIGRALGWPPDRAWAIAKEGLKRNPEDDGLYFAALGTVSPKWGGTPGQIDRYINEVVAMTQAERGLEMYARLYAEVADEALEHRIFSESNASWSKMKQGFEDWMARYPSPAKINRLAYFACAAQDKSALLDALAQIGSKPLTDEWGNNGLRTFSTCKQWASAQ